MTYYGQRTLLSLAMRLTHFNCHQSDSHTCLALLRKLNSVLCKKKPDKDILPLVYLLTYIMCTYMLAFVSFAEINRNSQ